MGILCFSFFFFFGDDLQVYLSWMGFAEGARCGRSLKVAVTFAFRLCSLCSGTGSVRIAAVMSLTDVVPSLFLVQAAVAVVQLFPFRGSAQGVQVQALHVPSLVFTLNAVSMAGYWLKNSQQLMMPRTDRGICFYYRRLFSPVV